MKKRKKSRNWALVVFASIVIVLNIAVGGFSIAYVSVLGWWAALFIFGAISSIVLGLVAIKKNDPTWLLLDLILPN